MKPRIGITTWPRPVDVDGRPEPNETVPHAYVRAVQKAGGLPLLLPVVDDVDDLLASVDGVIVTGGGDVDPARYGAPPHPETGGVDPARDQFDTVLWNRLLDGGIPTLGVCRAVQILNVVRGGTLHQHLPEHRLGDGLHPATIEPGSRLAAVVGATELEVNSLHHQGVDRVGEGLVVTARSPDGAVEALEVDGAPHVLAVQWHPELLRYRPEQLALFEDLVSRSGSR